MFASRYNSRKVLVTGNTGFKGSWLCHWLLSLGARVTGFALKPEPHETLFGELMLNERLDACHFSDIRDANAIAQVVIGLQPDFIFHLAAQPLVRKSFEIPVETFATNVMGTVNLLDSLRRLSTKCNVVVVTTDKCYENREWVHSYREEDAMGGYDPYSASKGCAELVTAAYRRSFFPVAQSPIAIASARAGNVVGGGDWAIDRIVPDAFRALQAGNPLQVRNKHATRPWQHVLEPLSGYLWLGACLDEPSLSHYPATELRSAFNFGPSLHSNQTVASVVEQVLIHVPGIWEDRSDPNALHEASKLNLAVDKAFHLLQWSPIWGFERTIAETAAWYTAVSRGECAPEITSRQIDQFFADALKDRVRWAIT